MVRLLLVALAASVLCAGCLTGDSYPKTYAAAYCASLFACVDEGEIDTWLGYDDEKECKSEVQSDLEGSATFDAYQEGDRTFDGDQAGACIEEVDQIRDDSDCGDMNILEFGIDASADACGEVYPEAD